MCWTCTLVGGRTFWKATHVLGSSAAAVSLTQINILLYFFSYPFCEGGNAAWSYPQFKEESEVQKT